jgi:phosphoribosyl 1,2-cyclic phosphodiesterase
VKICVLGSGSAGNCTYVETRGVRLLIDLGFGKRSLARRLHAAGLEPDRFDALLLTHGHSDHVRGAASGSWRETLPSIFATEGTWGEIAASAPGDRRELLHPGRPFLIGDVKIDPFAVSHDAAQPVGLRIEAEGICGAVVTDLGELSEAVCARLDGCDWLIIESNHDEELLKIGPYPWFLKQRLLSPVGHLSNQELGSFLTDRFDGSASHVFLAHLSRQNNDPAVALNWASRALTKRIGNNGTNTQLHLTHQDKPSIVLAL